ncbi:transporter substrate-binding domain-containing protein [Neiella sp. HB171785]|uniref:Transporter substrate-binding domain-containing protein n=1 Tax=Neiella litorisoli TaxID=2771431 RepID=A0A8J6QJ13_9GAMM|nr:transporter substrate-binding domain-containing protein [Neiella litorisoli]
MIQAEALQQQPVYTAPWPPFVTGDEEHLGSAERIVQLVLYQMKRSPSWQHIDYYFSFKMAAEGDITAAFPFFKTRERQAQALFSAPLMRVENGMFYSERWHQDISKLAVGRNPALKFGRVAGYSYGQQIDELLPEAKIFSSELLALEALANGDIDLLPISIQVAKHLIRRYMPHKTHEFKVLNQHRAYNNVYLVAPNNASGQAFIEQFDQALATLKAQGLFDEILSSGRMVEGSGFIRLVPAEGFPVVTGYQLTEDGSKQFFVIPQGSRGEVLRWHPVVLKPHDNEQIFDGMMRYSLVQIANGPHAGKQLYIRNMHIEID